MKKVSRIWIASLSSVIAFGSIGIGTSVFADAINKKEYNTSSFRTEVPSIVEKVSPNINELKELGVTVSEIKKLLLTKSSGVYLIDGVAYDRNGKLIEQSDPNTITTQGKFTAVIKLLKAGWDKLPSGVQDAIGGTAGFAALLNTIDHFTGSVEDAIYQGCLALGMSETVAWWVTKTLTWVSL
ncbi:hypothetical protein [Paenibacillus sp. YPG26]|uniref:hypothetical protein n=1 Tax=Paenibacillus sp. YPG26 TaxID=2878915 RepID=UPI00203CBA5F|nr:hypothetical protein [Paenibacillus sp. YPG26]USB31695.1 hypothetical protein LDO05_10045 [Paenibacillus sp. YPG26]